MTDQAIYKSPEEFFNSLLAVKSPSIDDLKLLMLLEAAGKSFYDWYIEGAPNEQVRELLARNGQEEIGHAHRLKRVIKILHGEDFPIPADEQNPYCNPPAVKPVLSKESLTELANSEFGGEAFYDGWATSVGNEEAAKLLRQNGKEETRHGTRAMEAVAFLPH